MKDNHIGRRKFMKYSVLGTALTASSKAALEVLTLNLAKQGASFNVLANAIRAGFIHTGIHNNIPGKNISERINLIPMKKAGSPVNIADAVSFLAGRHANYITGQILAVSGGE